MQLAQGVDNPSARRDQVQRAPGASARDYAAADSFPLAKLERLLRDCEEQPAWRQEADICCAYVDGKQLSPTQMEWCRRNNLEPRQTNLIGRAINGILGQEAKSRRDPHIEADDDDQQDLCDVFSVKLKEVQREASIDMAISNGYKGQVSAGIGWVEVSRCSDPLEYPYRVQDVHRNEIWWDWRAKAIDLRDARWLCRRRWIDLDEAQAQFPEYADALEAAIDNWVSIIADDWQDDERMSSAFNSDRAFGGRRSDWCDAVRRRVKFYEVWYRVPAQVVMLKLGPTWVQYQASNPLHVEAVARGLVKVERRNSSVVRMALYAGPYRLFDVATMKRRFPYIPFFAFRDDADNTPYGLVHGMRDPQDEYNERRLRIQWMLKAQQLLIDSDALDDEHNNIEDIVATMMRPDMVAVLNPNRKNRETPGGGMTFRNDLTLQKEQYEAMQDSKQLIQDVPGIYSTQLGNAPAGVTSGLAINSLIEQGQISMGELNDNYAFARQRVFEAVLDLIAEDYTEPNIPVSIGTGSTRRTVVLNARVQQPIVDPASGQPVIDPATGQPKVVEKTINRVEDMKLKCGLSEAPSSPAYLMQVSQMIGGLLQGLAGTPQANVLLPVWVETTTAFGPGRKQIADDMRRMTGLPVTGDRAGADAWRQAQAQQQAQAQALQQQGAQVQQQAMAAKADHDSANAELDRTNAQLAHAKATQIQLQVAHDFHANRQLPAPTPEQQDQARIDDVLRRAGGS